MKIGYFKLLYYLFFAPEVFRVLKEEKRWWKGFIALILTSVIFGGLMITIQAPKLTKEASEIARWVVNTVPDTTYVENKLMFSSSTQTFPIQSSFDDISLYFNDKDLEVTSDHLVGTRGFWFTPSYGFAWLTNDDGELIRSDVYKDGKFANSSVKNKGINELALFLQQLKLNPNEVVSIAKIAPLVGLIFMGLLHIFAVTLLLLGLITLHRVLGSLAFKDYSFGQSFSIYCYMSIPGFILATIWSSPLINFGKFNTIFTLALIVNLFFRSGKYLINEDLLSEEQK